MRIGIPHAEYVAGLTATERHLGAIARLIAPQGILALIDDPETLDIVPFKTKAATIAWEFMFTRAKFGTPDMARRGFILDELAALVDAGLIATTLTRTFDALTPKTLAAAHAFVESAKGFGKVALPGIGEQA